MGGMIRWTWTVVREAAQRGWFWCAAGLALVVASLLPVDWAKVALGAWTKIASPSGAIFFFGLILLAIGLFVSLTRAHKTDAETEKPPEVRPLRWWWIVFIAIGIAYVTMIAWGVFTYFGTRAPVAPQQIPQARIDAVRTALTLGAGLVGAVALMLASRRQWLAEHSQRHVETEAIKQRATDYYAKAAEQLGSDKAPVKMAGLYTLERLGQDNSEYRQTVVDLLCAYLRMPFTHPDYDTPQRAGDAFLADTEQRQEQERQEQQRQEIHVRRTAQKILLDHLRPALDEDGNPTQETFWKEMDLDLTGAALEEFDFGACHAADALFTSVRFYGNSSFEEAFLGGVWFDEAEFHESAVFDGAQFEVCASFDYAHFHHDASFDGADFHNVWFKQAHFDFHASFKNALFGYEARFDSARFNNFKPRFDGARFRVDVGEENTWPAGWIPGGESGLKSSKVDEREGYWGFLVEEENSIDR